MKDIVERFRYRVDNYTAHYSTSDRDLDKLIYNHLRKVEARALKAEARVAALEDAIKRSFSRVWILREAEASEKREQFLQKVRAL